MASQLAFDFKDQTAPTLRLEPGPNDLERWHPIDGWPGYEVSDWGRVRSYWTPAGRTGNLWRIGSAPRLCHGHTYKSGHIYVNISKGDGKTRRTVSIHVLVLEAFVGPRPSEMEACHNDGNPGNNCLDNLRWDTRRGNQQDALRHGKLRCARLTEADIPVIWKRLVEGETASSIARDFDQVNPSAIRHIKNGSTWKHITKNLPGLPQLVPTAAVDVQPIYVPAIYAQSEEEIWRQVLGWPAYRISNFGRAQTCWKRAKTGKSVRIMTDQWRDLSLITQHRGHLQFQVYHGGRKAYRKVHVCVLEAFACPRPHGMVACHGDGNPANNRANNLRWDTRKANFADMILHGAGSPLGMGKKRSLSDEDLAMIRELAANISQAKIAEMYHISPSYVSMILKNRRGKL